MAITWREAKKTVFVQTLFIKSKRLKITQGDCLHPSYRSCIRFQVAFRACKKIEGQGSQTILSFSGFESVGIKRHCQGSAVSKNREDGPKMGHGIKSTLGLSSRQTKRPKHVLCQGLTPFSSQLLRGNQRGTNYPGNAPSWVPLNLIVRPIPSTGKLLLH